MDQRSNVETWNEAGDGNSKVSDGERPDADSSTESKARTGRLQESLGFLQEHDPQLLRGLEKCRIDRVPLTIYVEGYEHCAQTVLALLRCAHMYGVNLTIMPFPMRTVRDAASPKLEFD